MLTDADLLARLPNFEDHFVERKPSRDSRDWKKTLVGFANSAVVGYPAVLFIGVRPDGTIEDGIDADKLSIEFSAKTADVYPPVHYIAKALSKDGKPFLAVIVPGSEHQPHFAGRSYVRNGSQTMAASEAQFNELIAQRNSKTREILKWKGMQVIMGSSSVPGRRLGRSAARVVDCNQFYVTLRTGSPEILISAPLVDLEISLDHTTSPACLMLLFNQTRW